MAMFMLTHKKENKQQGNSLRLALMTKQSNKIFKRKKSKAKTLLSASTQRCEDLLSSHLAAWRSKVFFDITIHSSKIAESW